MKNKFVLLLIIITAAAAAVFLYYRYAGGERSDQVAEKPADVSSQSSDRSWKSETPMTPPKVASTPSSLNWEPGVVNGIVAGKSTETDLVRALGKPLDTERMGADGEFGQDESNAVLLYKYNSVSPIPGVMTVTMNAKTGVIQTMDIVLNQPMPSNLAVQYVDGDYKRVKYAFDECSQSSESGPGLYVSPGGPIEFIEYPEKGISMHVTGDGQVQIITYSTTPHGAARSSCQ